MNSIFSYAYRAEPHTPVVRAFYDRADMVATTPQEKTHLHSVSEFMYVAEGHADVLVHPDIVVPLQRRQFIWLDAFVAHQLLLTQSRQCSMMNVEFDLVPSGPGCPSVGQLSRQDGALAGMLEHPVPYLVLSDEGDAIYSLLKQIIRLETSGVATRDFLSSLLATTLLVLTAHRRQYDEAARSAPVKNRHVAEALAYIQGHYQEPVTALQLSEMLHIHPSYLHRLFQRHMGQSVNETLRQTRMQAARRLLTETDDNLLDIAAAVGIGSQQYFVQLFKRVYGVSPSEYRKMVPENKA